jgi:hypothetical protein
MAKNMQRGLSSIVLLLILAVGGVVLTIAFSVGPLYIDNYFVNGALQTLKESNPHQMSDLEIRKKVNNSFTVNNVRGIDIRSLKIERQRTKTLVMLDYEKRVHLMGNLSVVVDFENRFDSSE